MYSFIQSPSINYDGRILPMPVMFNLKGNNGKNTNVSTNQISDTLKKYIDDKFNELSKNLVVPSGGINQDELTRFGSQLKEEIKGDIMSNIDSLVEKANDAYFQNEDFKQRIVELNKQLAQMYEGRFADLMQQINVLTAQNKDLTEDVEKIKNQGLNQGLNLGLNLTDTPNMDDYVTKEQYTKDNEFLKNELNARMEDSLRMRGDVTNILKTELPKVYDAVNDNDREIGELQDDVEDNEGKIEKLQEDVEDLNEVVEELIADLRNVESKVYDASQAISPEAYAEHLEEFEKLTTRVNSLNRDRVTRDEINSVKDKITQLRTDVNTKVSEIYKNVNSMVTKKLDTITEIINGLGGEVPADLSQTLTDLIQQINSINQQAEDSIVTQAQDANMKQEIISRLEMIESQLKQYEEELDLNNQELAEINLAIKRNTEQITSNMNKREKLYQGLIKRIVKLESKPEPSTTEFENLSAEVARMKESGNRNIQTLVSDIKSLKQIVSRLQQNTGNVPIPTDSGNIDLTQVQASIAGIESRLNLLSTKLNTMATNTDLTTLRTQVDELAQEDNDIKTNYNMLVSTLKILQNTKSIPTFVDGVNRLQKLETKYLQHAGSICGAFNC
jgi:chromosome segregation ATPase